MTAIASLTLAALARDAQGNVPAALVSVLVDDTRALVALMGRADTRLDTAKEATDDAKGERSSVSRWLATTALRSVLAGCEDAVKEKFAGTDAWKKIKGAWSTGARFARELDAGNYFLVPRAGEGEAATEYTVAGVTYAQDAKVDRAVLAGLVDPIEADTSILVLGKARSAFSKMQRTRASDADKAEHDILAAYLASPDGKAKYERETPETLRNCIYAEAQGDAVKASGEYARCLETGRARKGEHDARLAAEHAEKERANVLLSALGVITREMNDEIADNLSAIIAEYRARSIPAASTAQPEAKRGKRAA